jgi:hypothetical protein
MRARWLIIGLVAGAITIWALLVGFINQHQIRGMLTLDEICFHGTSRFEGCLNNATLIPLFNGTVTAGNATCAPLTTYDSDGLFLNWTCIPVPPPTTIVQLNGSVIGPSDNNTLACINVTAGTYGGADLVSLTIGCDGRVTQISNGGVALTSTTQFNGDVTGPFNNLSLVAIPGLPSNWTVGSSSCIPFLEGDGKGRITYQTCINLTVASLANGTLILATPHETTVMTNGTTITVGTVQPIDVTSTPTFAGITINGAAQFNANGAPPVISLSPTVEPIELTGRAATSGVFGDYLFTPALVWYPGVSYPSRTDQSRNYDDSLIAFDVTTSQELTPSVQFTWLGSATSVTPYAIWKNSNALNFLSFTQPGSAGAQVTPSTMLTMTPAAAAFMIPVTMASTLIVSGATTLQSTLDVTGVLTSHGALVALTTFDVTGLLTAHGNVVVDGTQNVAGLATFGTGIQVPTVGGLATPFTYYEDDVAYLFTASGPWAPVAASAIVERVGFVVTIQFPTIFATSTTTSAISLSPGLPSKWRPTEDCRAIISITNGGQSMGLVTISHSTGDIGISLFDGTSFTSGQTVGWLANFVVTFYV